MEVSNFAIGPILSWIRHWMERRRRAAAGARDPPLATVANYIAALPTDMLHEILLRLPADEACRVRLVCPTWRSMTFDPHFARAHASRHQQPHVIVVRHDDDAAEVRDLDLHGNVIKSIRIRQTIGRLSMHGDLLCASHGWGLTRVVDMITGAVTDVGVDHRKKVNSATPYCVLGHVPATGEYKVLRIQADYSSRQRRQMCEVVTLGVDGDTDAGRWRRRTCPPVTLWTLSSWTVAVVAGLVYFVDCWGTYEDNQILMADSLAVFDLASEEWKPLTLQGPLTHHILNSTDVDVVWEDDDDDPFMEFIVDPYTQALCLRRHHFQLARLGDNLVVLYCDVNKSLTELWFMENMEDDATARWSKRYTLQCTPFGDDKDSLQYHYPLAVLDDKRIVVWVERTSALKAYDPETCTWTDLATLTGDCVVGMHHGSLLCSNNVGAPKP